VDLTEGSTSEGIAQIIHDLFTYYRPGVTPPTDEELTGAKPAAS
jgi:hypothetical protein